MQLLQRLRLVHAIHRRVYGRPRLHRALRADGIRISPKRVARLRRFAVAAPHQQWAADITAVPTPPGWCSLAVLIDVGSRRVVGWAVRASLETALGLAALHVALGTRPHPRLHHSDRGRQYASSAYRTVLEAQGITVSMSRTGHCWDNAIVERFFSSLKAELVRTAQWTTPDEAEAAIASYLRFYNQQRLHSALDYRSPAHYESDSAVAL